MPGTLGWMVCHAHKTNGEPCKAPVVRGAKVCIKHGGAAGHVREAARRRLDTLVEPAISKLRVLLLRGDSHAIQLKAATEILDRAGIVMQQQVEVDNQVTVTVSYADVIDEARKVVGHDAQVVDVGYVELPETNGTDATRNGHETE